MIKRKLNEMWDYYVHVVSKQEQRRQTEIINKRKLWNNFFLPMKIDEKNHDRTTHTPHWQTHTHITHENTLVHFLKEKKQELHQL
jgi:hypothetical protein